MEPLRVGQVIRNTDPDWWGYRRQVTRTNHGFYEFVIIDGNRAGRKSNVSFRQAEAAIRMGSWRLDYPDTLQLPQGA